MSDGLRILVVDDDTEAADSLAELFEMEGHDVTVVYDGAAAVEAYRDMGFDIAFMDIMMPGMNGVESFLEIRKIRPAAQVYMMTGFSVEQLIEQTVENGAMGVLNKPIDLSMVLGMLDSMQSAGIVLVVEDDPDFGPQLLEVIERQSYRCMLASDGREAIDMAMKHRIDVLILDLKLPIVDGIEVYSTLKTAGRELPVIIITGHEADYADNLATMRDIAVTGILNKPFDPSKLIEQLNSLTQKSKAA